eukprot:Opistho-2@90553
MLIAAADGMMPRAPMAAHHRSLLGISTSSQRVLHRKWDSTSRPQSACNSSSLFIVAEVALFVCAIILAPAHSMASHTKSQPPTFVIVSIETSSDDVIALTLEGASGNMAAPNQSASQWLVNGVCPTAVGRFSRPWHQDAVDSSLLTMRHSFYFVLENKLMEGRVYEIIGPDNITATLAFSEAATHCESIHASQVGYFQSLKAKFENFGVFLGDLGAQQLLRPPSYSVIDAKSITVLGPLNASYLGYDAAHVPSGEHVYRMDLSDIPSGGPYRLVVHGHGCSHPFGVGTNYTDALWYTITRGLYHKRCGIAVEARHSHWSRCACHTSVLVTDAQPGQFVTEDSCLGGCSTYPSRPIKGGYHDAGDFDRGPGHTLFGVSLLETFEFFKDDISDFVLDIPESDNEIPDYLDEAMWAILLWEQLQESDGGVRAGTEAESHPVGGDNAGSDRLVYRTFRRHWHSTASAVGMYACVLQRLSGRLSHNYVQNANFRCRGASSVCTVNVYTPHWVPLW